MTPQFWLALKHLSPVGRHALMEWLLLEGVIQNYDRRCLSDHWINGHLLGYNPS